MARVNLETLVVGREAFDKAVDRSFSELVNQVPIEITKSVEQFFQDYEELYYEIPVEGSTMSHRYLLEMSSKLVTLEKNLDDIQPLLDEIANLRTQNLKLQQELITGTTKVAQNAV